MFSLWKRAAGCARERGGSPRRELQLAFSPVGRGRRRDPAIPGKQAALQLGRSSPGSIFQAVGIVTGISGLQLASGSPWGRRGVLLLLSPVTSRSPEGRTPRHTTRRPRLRPDSRMRTLPASMEDRTLAPAGWGLEPVFLAIARRAERGMSSAGYQTGFRCKLTLGMLPSCDEIERQQVQKSSWKLKPRSIGLI